MMTNQERAEKAARAVLAYAENDYLVGEELSVVIQDLIGDLRHLVDRPFELRSEHGWIGPIEDWRDWSDAGVLWKEVLEGALENYTIEHDDEHGDEHDDDEADDDDEHELCADEECEDESHYAQSFIESEGGWVTLELEND